MFKKILIFGFVCILTLCLLAGWKRQTEPYVYFASPYQRIDIASLAEKAALEEDEYRILFSQTGLSRRAIETIPSERSKDILLYAQEAFFSAPRITCGKSGIVSWEEQNEGDCLPDFISLEEGDILLSFCCHTFGWRNGHAAIVINAKEGTTLEAVMIGEDACLQNVRKWRYYPSFLVLRLKGQPLEVRKKIARYAYDTMEGVPYGFSADLLEHFGLGEKIRNTDCSHLIWKVYKEFGFDLDSDGGFFVTPQDIAESSLLEVIQVYGIDFSKIHENS